MVRTRRRLRTAQRPNFFIVGAMKSGTTSLYSFLRSHPAVFMTERKEIDFFSEHWERGLEWYDRFFLEVPSRAVAVGEASTSYTRYPNYTNVAQRMYTLFPEAKLIYVIRHPIHRMLSHYLHSSANGRETRPLEEALTEDPNYLNISRYSMQIEVLLQHFRPDQLAIVTSDGLRERREEVVRGLFRFLNVDESWSGFLDMEETNRTSDKMVYPWAIRIARQLTPRSRLRRLKRLGRKVMRTARIGDPVRTEKPEIPESLREFLRAELRDDVDRLKLYISEREIDIWRL